MARRRIERTRRTPATAEPDGKPRRDPHAERGVRTGQEAAKDRARRNPHAERAASTVVGNNARPRRQLAAASVSGPSNPDAMQTALAAAANTDEIVAVRQPDYLIFAVPDAPEGYLTPHDRDLFGAARGLADAGGGAVVALLFQSVNDDLQRAGADRVLRFDHSALAGYAPEARTEAVVAAIAEHRPRHVVLPDSPLAGADLGRRIAAKLGERAATGVLQLAADRAVRCSDGGRTDLSLAPTRVLLLAAEAADPVDGNRYQAQPLAAPQIPRFAAARLNDLGMQRIDPESVALNEAEFVVAGGNGVRDWSMFEQLAQGLGATIGGSRVAVDQGHLPRDRQIGATGTQVSARVYLALGISGAPQHLQGITDCEHVIAVNRDANCDLMKRADLAVVGELHDIMSSLLQRLQADTDD